MLHPVNTEFMIEVLVAFVPDKVELERVISNRFTFERFQVRLSVELEIVEAPLIFIAVDEATVGV